MPGAGLSGYTAGIRWGGEVISNDPKVAEGNRSAGVQPQNRKYLGSKYRLIDFITRTILARVDDIASFADLFAGTGVVSTAFRAHSPKIIANDLLYSNYAVNRAFLTSTRSNADPDRVADLIEELNECAPVHGYASSNFAGTYFSDANAARIDGIREAIDRMAADQRCSEQERIILLASLLFAMDKVANTVGQYDAFLKHIDEHAVTDKHLIDSNVYKPIRLRVPGIDLTGNSANQVFNLDANQLIHRVEVEVLYLDPPYNTRQYVDCYHVLENILRWNKPRLQGKTRKFRRDHLKSRYSRKTEAAAALEELIGAARAKHIFLSYNNEGIIPEAAIREILGRRGSVEVFSREYSVFGNGAGSARKRTVEERIFYCRTGGQRRGPASAPAPKSLGAPEAVGTARAGGSAAASQKIELFDERGKSRGFYSPRNRLNDLTGKEWVYWSKSVINKTYAPNLQHKLRSSHGGQKPPDLCGDLVEVFTKRGQWVLDPFAGVGGTLLGAALRGRNAVGVEINPEWIRIYRQVCSLENISEQRMICGDSGTVLQELSGEGLTFDMVCTDVPYWVMDRARRSKGSFKRVGEQKQPARRSKLTAFNGGGYVGKDQWLREMARIFTAAAALLRDRGYLVVFIGDMYSGGRYHFLSSDLAGILARLGLVPKANLIWYDVSKSLHVYGYQYEYIPSMIHQNILVFRKQLL